MIDALLSKIRLHAIRLIAIVIYFKILCIGITLTLLPGSDTIVIPIGIGIFINDLLWTRKFLKTIKNKYYQKRELTMPVKPSDNEEEYFTKLDLERRKKIHDEKMKLSMEEGKIKLKELHYMRCPKCGMELKEINYKGINVDKCASCDGVWFDAGEIDNLLKLEKPAINKLFSVFKK